MRITSIYFCLVITLALLGEAIAGPLEDCMLQRNAGKYREAVSFGEQAVSIDKESMPAWYCLGDSWGRMGFVPPAISALTNGLAVAKRDFDRMKIYYRIGEILHDSGNDPKAELEAWTRCIELAVKIEDPKTRITAMHQRAILLAEAGEVDKAIAEYTALEALLKGDKRWSVVMNNLAALYVKKKQYTNAFGVINRAIQEDMKAGDKANLYNHQASLGYIELLNKNYRAASIRLLSTYESATKDKYKDDRFWASINRYLSEMYLALGNIDKAKYHAAEGLKYQPSDQKPSTKEPPKKGSSKRTESGRH